MKDYDIVIVGSGIVGLIAALSLAKNSELHIAILEANPPSPEWKKETYDHRVSAISLASKNIFQNLKVWDSIIKKRISPYTQMHVWDAESEGQINFNCNDVNENALGFIIEDNVMRVSLLEKIREYDNIHLLFSSKLLSISDEMELTIENQPAIKTKLLIAADGANSRVRELTNIELNTHDYEHTAIVASVITDDSHQKTAWQRFLPTGPLAFLPLINEEQSSIVWSTSHNHAKELLAKTDEEFCKILTDAFQKKLGQIKTTSKRYHFPLRMRHAKQYVKNRLALIGDAAHTIHPLAGQGVNLGLQDAICLSGVVLEAVKKNRDFSSLATLRRYERFRKSDNLTMLSAVEILKQLFSSHSSVIKTFRGAGLIAANRMSFLKNFFINYALGKR